MIVFCIRLTTIGCGVQDVPRRRCQGPRGVFVPWEAFFPVSRASGQVLRNEVAVKTPSASSVQPEKSDLGLDVPFESDKVGCCNDRIPAGSWTGRHARITGQDGMCGDGDSGVNYLALNAIKLLKCCKRTGEVHLRNLTPASPLSSANRCWCRSCYSEYQHPLPPLTIRNIHYGALMPTTNLEHATTNTTNLTDFRSIVPKQAGFSRASPNAQQSKGGYLPNIP